MTRRAENPTLAGWRTCSQPPTDHPGLRHGGRAGRRILDTGPSRSPDRDVSTSRPPSRRTPAVRAVDPS